MNITKNCTVAIVGRPNAGKSTLINALVGEKIAIVTSKPQTTRYSILGIVNNNGTQYIFTDTPGFHKPRNRLGDNMSRAIANSMAGSDACVLVVPPENKIGKQEEILLGRITQAKIPCVLAINKIDTIRKDALFEIITAYTAYAAENSFEFACIVPISAKKADGVTDIVAEIEKYAQKGGALFSDAEVTDQTDVQIISETIREKLLSMLDREVPHGIAVEIEKFSERDGASGEPIIDVDAVIYCEKQSHKGIIVGKNGENLREAGRRARMDIEKYMGTKVNLHTFVKVREDWRDRPNFLREMGLEEK